MAIIVGVTVGAYFLLKKSPAVAAITTPPGWNIQYSPGMPTQMTDMADGRAYFDFPVGVDGVHYITKPASPLALGQTITLAFEIVGGGTLVPTQGDPPAKIRLLIQQRGDDMATPDARCVANIQNIGLTFGGEFAGHGVFAQGGPSRFILNSFTVT